MSRKNSEGLPELQKQIEKERAEEAGKKERGEKLKKALKEADTKAEKARIKKRMKEIEKEALEEARIEKRKKELAKEAIEEEEEVPEISDEDIISEEPLEEKEDIKALLEEIKPKHAEKEKTEKKSKSEKRIEILSSYLKEEAKDVKISKDFTELEEGWFEKGENLTEDDILESVESLPAKAKEAVIEDQSELLDAHYEGGMEKLDLDWKEYTNSSDNITILDQRRERIENILFDKFEFDITRSGLFKKFNVKRKLDPEDKKEFETLIAQYKFTSKAYNKHLKTHNKKFADAIDQLTPKTRSRVYINGRSMPVKGVGIGIKG